MNKKITTLTGIIIIVVIAIATEIFVWKYYLKTNNEPEASPPKMAQDLKPSKSDTNENEVGISNKITITSLKPNDEIGSPLSILGKAVGGWFFEGSFPIEIYDDENKKIGSKYCSFVPKTEDETWMTEEFVDFKCDIQFDKPKTNNGYIIFKKDNPSDMRELDEEFKLPVKFSKNIESVSPLDWRSYKNEKLGFKLGFLESWKGYIATESDQPNDQGVCFSFKNGHQPFCMMNIRVVLENDWNKMPNKSVLTKITEDNGRVYFCDGCCGQKGDTGGGQFDEFQKDRCDEAEKILQTFELIIKK